MSNILKVVALSWALGCGSAAQTVTPAPVEVAAASVEAEPPPASAIIQPPPGFSEGAYEIASGHEAFTGRILAPVREYRSENVTLLIVWPAFDRDGQLTTESETFAVTVDHPDGTPPVIRDVINVTELRPEDIVPRLGGTLAVTVSPTVGVSEEEIAPALDAPVAFVRSVREGDLPSAMLEVARMSAMHATGDIHQLYKVAGSMLAEAEARFSTSYTGIERISETRLDVHLTLEIRGRSPSPIALPLGITVSGRWVLLNDY